MKTIVTTSCLAAALIFSSQPSAAGDLFGDLLNQAVNKATQGRVGNVDQVVRSVSSPGAAPAQQQGIFARNGRTRFESGTPFNADYIADYWKQPDASTRGDDASSDALGHIITKPTFGGNQKQAGVPEMRRKLEKILAQVLMHTALKDIRGASLAPGGGFYREKGGPMGPTVAGHLSLTAYTIFLKDPKTLRFEDGTYHTPGNEGEVLRVEVNDTDLLEGRVPLGTYNGLTVVSRSTGYMLVVPNTDRPVYLTEGGAQVLNPNLIDPSRPRADIQFMTIYVGAASTTWADIARGKEKPTSAVGRLLGVMFNTDWPSLLRQVN